ncbi:MAG: DUF2877 domain-containing protein [Actinomycetota bacterium]
MPTVLAASDAIADLLTGPLVSGEVIHRSGPAAYLRTDDGRVLALEEEGGIGLPIAARVDALGTIAAGDAVAIGGIAPGRWWSANVPTIRPAPTAIAQLRELVEALPASDDPLERPLDDADPLADPAAVVGLGPGLTPAGDDLVAGALVALRAVGRHETADRVVREAASVEHRTTPISAALLREAAVGRAAQPLLRMLDALIGPAAPIPALDALVEVGATSGRWLARGLAFGLEQL